MKKREKSLDSFKLELVAPKPNHIPEQHYCGPDIIQHP